METDQGSSSAPQARRVTSGDANIIPHRNEKFSAVYQLLGSTNVTDDAFVAAFKASYPEDWGVLEQRCCEPGIVFAPHWVHDKAASKWVERSKHPSPGQLLVDQLNRYLQGAPCPSCGHIDTF